MTFGCRQPLFQILIDSRVKKNGRTNEKNEKLTFFSADVSPGLLTMTNYLFSLFDLLERRDQQSVNSKLSTRLLYLHVYNQDLS